MPAATTSGAEPTSGNAKSRDHNQGNQERKYTVEQKQAVVRVRRCSPTDFYDILGLEEVRKTVADGEIKKAYRKLSLLTHPDKNGYEGADEAFKLVSRAFQILSDPDKKSKFDRFGGDPDSRFGGGSSASPFSGFARSASGSSQRGGPGMGGGRPMWEEEISPEEMFDRFFSGGMGGMGGGGFGPFGGGGGIFDSGPGFGFNLGPGFRVYQMGGGRPRRRPREANDENAADEEAPSVRSTLYNLLPLLLLVLLPLLSALFSGEFDGASSTFGAGPPMRFDAPQPPYTLHRTTPKLHVDYFVNPRDVHEWSARKLHMLDQRAEVSYVHGLRVECGEETDARHRMMQDAQGWFFQDVEKMERAREMELRSCRRLDELRVLRGVF